VHALVNSRAPSARASTCCGSRKRPRVRRFRGPTRSASRRWARSGAFPPRMSQSASACSGQRCWSMRRACSRRVVRRERLDAVARVPPCRVLGDPARSICSTTPSGLPFSSALDRSGRCRCGPGGRVGPRTPRCPKPRRILSLAVPILKADGPSSSPAVGSRHRRAGPHTRADPPLA